MKYTVSYTVNFGSMIINEEIYECDAWCEYAAYKKFLKDTKNRPHYTSPSNLESYKFMRKDIRRIK